MYTPKIGLVSDEFVDLYFHLSILKTTEKS
jgi:hypothetical protein